jgi:hypothetical protein
MGARPATALLSSALRARRGEMRPLAARSFPQTRAHRKPTPVIGNILTSEFFDPKMRHKTRRIFLTPVNEPQKHTLNLPQSPLDIPRRLAVTVADAAKACA